MSTVRETDHRSAPTMNIFPFAGKPLNFDLCIRSDICTV